MTLTLFAQADRYGNILERPNTVLSASQTPSNLFPLSRAADGQPDQVFIFPAIAANDYIQADINQLLNSLFELWTGGSPDSWVVDVTGDGAVSEHTGANVVSGSGLQLDSNTTGTAAVYQDILMRSGESFEVNLFGMTSDAGHAFQVSIQNLITGNYLTSGGAWQVTPISMIVNTATSLTMVTRQHVLESFSVTRSHIVPIRIRLNQDGTGANITHNYDNVLIYPGVNFASVHGHNIDPKMTVELHSDDNAAFSSPTDHGDFTVSVPTFFLKISTTQYARFWRVPQFTGTQSTVTGALEVGLCFLGQVISLLGAPSQPGLESAEILPQEQAESRLSRKQWRLRHAKHEQRLVQLQFETLTDAKETEFRNEVLKRTEYGVQPMLMVIRSDEADECIHGRRPPGEATFTIVGGEVSETSLLILESAFGIVTD